MNRVRIRGDHSRGRPKARHSLFDRLSRRDAQPLDVHRVIFPDRDGAFARHDRRTLRGGITGLELDQHLAWHVLNRRRRRSLLAHDARQAYGQGDADQQYRSKSCAHSDAPGKTEKSIGGRFLQRASLCEKIRDGTR